MCVCIESQYLHCCCLDTPQNADSGDQQPASNDEQQAQETMDDQEKSTTAVVSPPQTGSVTGVCVCVMLKCLLPCIH